MPLFFLLIGVLLVIVGLNNRVTDLGALIKEDFKPSDGSAGFAVWVLAIVIVGLLGNVKTIKPISNAFLILIVIMLLLSNKGFFAKFMSAVTKQDMVVTSNLPTSADYQNFLNG